MAVTRRSPPTLAVVAILLAAAFGAGAGMIRTLNANQVERSASILGAVAFTAVFVAPAALGLMGIRGRRALLFAAGALDLVLGFLGLFSLVGLVFFVPAVLFFVPASSMERDVGAARSVAAVVLSVALGTLAFLALFARDDPVCWATIGATGRTVALDPDRFVHGSAIRMGGSDLPPGTTGSGCSSDSISAGEGSVSLAVVAMMLLAAGIIARPRSHAIPRLVAD